MNSLEVDRYPWTGRYFQEVPVTLEAIPANGVVFSGWRNPDWPQTPVVTVLLGPRDLVQARFIRAPG